MNDPRIAGRLRQRGIVTVMAAVILIAAVIFVLSQALGISGSNSMDNTLQMQSTAALFQAESGIERAMGGLSFVNDPTKPAACAGLGVGFYQTGSGIGFTVSGASEKTDGTACVSTACPVCSVTSTGCVGCSASVSPNRASRTVNRKISTTATSGIGGQKPGAPTALVTMTLVNTSELTGVGFFNLATRRNGADRESVCSTVTVGTATVASCTALWNDSSQNGGGTPSVGGLGTGVVIAGGLSADIVQTMQDKFGNSDDTRNFAEVGAIVPGKDSTTAPSMVSGSAGNVPVAYETNSKTANNGVTNNGAATANTSACKVSGTPQTCTSWCDGYDSQGKNGADLLLMGFSGRNSTVSLTNKLAAVTFGSTTGSALDALVSFPADTPNAGALGAQGDVYADIWYKKNDAYSIGGVFKASVATTATVTFTASGASGDNKLIVTGTPSPSGVLGVGYVFTAVPSELPADTVIIGQTSGTAGQAGEYTLSNNFSSAHASSSLVMIKKTMTVPQASIYSGVIKAGETLASGDANGTTTCGSPKILCGTKVLLQGVSTGGNDIYYLSYNTAAETVATAVFSSGVSASGTTITVPSLGNMPLSNTTLIAVRSGSNLAGKSATASIISGNTFTLSTFSGTNYGVPLCGGACALFTQSKSFNALSDTSFSFTNIAETQEHWVAGFLCIRNSGTPSKVVKAGISLSTWQEPVQ